MGAKIGLTSPKIGHTMCYSFEFDEKIIRSLNKLSRNFEFHHKNYAECLSLRSSIHWLLALVRKPDGFVNLYIAENRVFLGRFGGFFEISGNYDSKGHKKRKQTWNQTWGEVGDDFMKNSDLFCFENLKYLLNSRRRNR